MLPSGKVDEETAVKIVACLGLGSERAPLQTQVCLWAVYRFVNFQVYLLRWLVMVFPYLASQRMLRQLYGVIFNFLNFVSLRY